MTLTVKQDINYLLDLADALQVEGTKDNIVSVFDDGGFRELVITRMFGLARMGGRHGDDGVDLETVNQYELKTVNLIDTKNELRFKPGITTCHHVNHEIIARYRNVSGFIVGIFYINEPIRVYEISPQDLEEYFQKWEDRLLNEENLNHINNPKFKFQDIIDIGKLHYRDSEYDVYFEQMVSKARFSKKDKQSLATELDLIRAKDIDFEKINEIREEARE